MLDAVTVCQNFSDFNESYHHHLEIVLHAYHLEIVLKYQTVIQ